MRQSLLGIIVFIGLLGSVYSLSIIRGQFVLKQAQTLASEKPNSESEGAAILEEVEDLSNRISSPSEVHKIAAAMYSVASTRTRAIDRIVELKCRQLSHIGMYLKENPQNGGSLVQWAMLRQELGKLSCTEPETEGDFRAAALGAVGLEGTSPGVLFRAGVVLLRAGEREQALSLFEKFISHGVGVSPQHEEVILSSLVAPDDVKAVVPPRFPQVSRWSILLKSRVPNLFEESRQNLEVLQLQAISSAISEFHSGNYPADLHLKRLLSLLPVAATEGVRVRVDNELSQYFLVRDLGELSDYFAARSGMIEQPIVRGVRIDDSQPSRSPIVEWNGGGTLFLDDRLSSVGFFIREPRSVRLIEIRNALESSGVIDTTSIKILISKDNQRWKELDSRVTISDLRIDGRQTLYIKQPEQDAHYWKIHFVGTDHPRSFFNSIDDMIRVFG